MIHTAPRPGHAAAMALLLCAGLALGLGATRAEAARSHWGESYFPNVPLVNEDGQTLHFYDDVIKGKVVAINFIYTSCQDTCPVETAKLRNVQELLGDRVGRDVFLYSITIDPKRDTPEVLKHYREKFRAGPGWEFLTGKEADIIQLRRKLGLYSEDLPDPGDHVVSLIVGNEETGQWMKRSSYDSPRVLAAVLGKQLHNHAAGHEQRVSYAQAKPRANITHGAYLFRTRCASCHSVGAGAQLGPDLKGVVAHRDEHWLKRWIKEPDRVLSEKDPIATALFQEYRNLPMPNLRLSDADVGALIEYLAEESGQSAEVGELVAAEVHHHHGDSMEHDHVGTMDHDHAPQVHHD